MSNQLYPRLGHGKIVRDVKSGKDRWFFNLEYECHWIRMGKIILGSEKDYTRHILPEDPHELKCKHVLGYKDEYEAAILTKRYPRESCLGLPTDYSSLANLPKPSRVMHEP